MNSQDQMFNTAAIKGNSYQHRREKILSQAQIQLTIQNHSNSAKGLCFLIKIVVEKVYLIDWSAIPVYINLVHFMADNTLDSLRYCARQNKFHHDSE